MTVHIHSTNHLWKTRMSSEASADAAAIVARYENLYVVWEISLTMILQLTDTVGQLYRRLLPSGGVRYDNVVANLWVPN